MTPPGNRLASETSPYLLQHADNPVHWRPWDDVALREAIDEDKPILLSIGYSACHWCHVMAHESFDDPQTAALMNRLYVNIKVDREERPDLDRIYQLAHQMLTRRAGGWPLTVVLTPRGHAPIFAGTYFPREPRRGMPTFGRVLKEVAAHYREHRRDMDEHDAAMKQNFERLTRSASGDSLDDRALDDATASLRESVDRRHGGFGQAPKFPHAGALACLLDALEDDFAAPGDIRGVIATTLDNMAAGGLFDQVGGGFYRYAVDEKWQIPHFEKMLYDNAQLMPLYAAASRALEQPAWAGAAIDTAEWALREMQLDSGGFCSSLDADSGDGEGRFYLWRPGETQRLLDADASRLASALFDLDRPANFEGYHHLNRVRSMAEAAREAHIDPDTADTLWLDARERLRRHRESRPRPARDDKCLASWNALMISALARTGRLLERTDFIAAAERAVEFLRATHVDGERLHAASRDGHAHLDAYLDDYVFLARALVDLLQCRWKTTDLDWCIRLIEHVLKHFAAPSGALYFTADHHEALLHRPTIAGDESMPSGNGIACQVLLELGHLTGEMRYVDAAESILAAFGEEVSQFPAGHGALIGALREARRPRTHVVIRGDDELSERWTRQLAQRYGHRLRCYPVGTAKAPALTQDAEPAPPGGVAAWVCTASRCLAPITDFPSLQKALDETLQ